MSQMAISSQKALTVSCSAPVAYSPTASDRIPRAAKATQKMNGAMRVQREITASKGYPRWGT